MPVGPPASDEYATPRLGIRGPAVGYKMYKLGSMLRKMIGDVETVLVESTIPALGRGAWSKSPLVLDPAWDNLADADQVTTNALGGIRHLGMDLVEISFAVQRNSATQLLGGTTGNIGDTPIATISEAYRPATSRRSYTFSVAGTTFGTFYIHKDGRILMETMHAGGAVNDNTWVFFHAIYCRA